MKDITAILKQRLDDLGVSQFGFARVDAVANHPYPHLPYAVSIAVKLSDEVIDAIETQPTYTYFHLYRTVNAFIDQACLQVALILEREGYRAVSIAASQSIPNAKTPYSGAFSHKAAARLAGLGTIGKSDLFLSYRYGPRVRLGTVLTNAPLPIQEAVWQDVCRQCNACVRACPAMAITGNRPATDVDRETLFDAQACSAYMKEHFQHIGRGVVCGICVQVCSFKGKEA